MMAVGEKVPRDLLRMNDFTDPACSFMAKILLEENPGRIAAGKPLRKVQ